MYQKNCIGVKFSERLDLDIFDDHYVYPEIDNGPIEKVVIIRGDC